MSRSFQQKLIQVLPDGVAVFRGMILRPAQERILELVRAAIREAPLFVPTMYDGTPLKIQMSNCGSYGWVADRKGYAYVKTHPETYRPWPPIPAEILELAQRAAQQAQFPGFAPESCLINFYRGTEGKLGAHQDRTERNQRAPIVTISLGDTAIFGMGGINSSDPVTELALDSGDVLVMGGSARMFHHQVKRLLPNSSDLLRGGGRVSLTLRRVT